MFSRALIQYSTLSIQHFVSVLSDFIHVDDFRGLPQILLLSIRQRFHPIIIRLFTELSRLCRHSRFLLRRRRISLLWRLLSFSLLGRIHINGHGCSNIVAIQCSPRPSQKSMVPLGYAPCPSGPCGGTRERCEKGAIRSSGFEVPKTSNIHFARASRLSCSPRATLLVQLASDGVGLQTASCR